jgi:flagellar biosynthesis/type III secretory pathway protein FliH
MKSYSKFVPSEFLDTFEDWAPSTFVSEEKQVSDPKVEEILAIFNGLISGKDPHRPTGSQSLIQAEVSYPVSSWMPEEISWVPPFNSDEWPTWNEQKIGEPVASVNKEPDPRLPSPEEERAATLAAAHSRADEILAAAQQKADKIILEAQEEMRRSVEEGYQHGFQTSQTDAETVIHAAHEVVSELIRWREDMLARSEITVVSMIRDIARFMFGDGVKLDELGLQMNLSRVLENAKSLGDVRIFLNPGDAIRLDPAWKEYQTMLSGNKVIIVPSEGVKPGGCFVQGETGSIDARVEAQLETALGVFDQTIEVA